MLLRNYDFYMGNGTDHLFKIIYLALYIEISEQRTGHPGFASQ